MATILQTTFSNAFSWMEVYEFRLQFHWSLLLRDQLTIIQHWVRYWLGADQWWPILPTHICVTRLQWVNNPTLGRLISYSRVWWTSDLTWWADIKLKRIIHMATMYPSTHTYYISHQWFEGIISQPMVCIRFPHEEWACLLDVSQDKDHNCFICHAEPGKIIK